jgi:hypothetical protein
MKVCECANMLCENCVSKAIRDWLPKQGFVVEGFCTTVQQGVDIRARSEIDAEIVWHIEAKGGTSTRIGSPRYGRPFTQSQLIDRAMKGVYTALQLSDTRGLAECRVSLGFPEVPTLRRYIGAVEKALGILDISVLWVEPGGLVHHWQPNN